MKKVFYIVFLLALHLKVLHAEIAVDWDIKRLEDKFRSEAELGLKEYLGPTKKFKVYIQVIGKKNTEEKKSADYRDSEFGYLSIADSYQDIKVSEKVMVKSIAADIFIYDKVDKNTLKNIRKIATGAMKGFPSSINLNVMPSPPTLEENTNDLNQPFNFKKIFLEHLSDILKLISNLIISAIGLLGIYLLSRALIAAFKSISEAIKNDPTNNKEHKKEDDSVTEEEDKEDEINTDHQKFEEILNNQIEIQHERSLEIVKTCLRTAPHVFKQVLVRNDENFQGFKVLLPQIVEFTSKLKEIISIELWKKIDSIDGINESLFGRWLNRFAEDLSIAQMTDTGYFSCHIESTLFEKIHSAKLSHLIEASIKVNSCILFKFLLDFLPSNESINLMKHFDDKTWSKILSERQVNPIQLNKDISEMLETVEAIVEKDKREINDHDFSRIFSNPLSLFLKDKDFEEAEEFFKIISYSAPELSESIKAKFWTPRMLFRIPKDYLTEKFNILSVEGRVLILLGVQEDLREHLLTCIPEGKVMTIVTDQYSRDFDIQDERQKSRSTKTIKDFLNALKEDLYAEKFELKEESEALMSRETSHEMSVVKNSEMNEITQTNDKDSKNNAA